MKPSRQNTVDLNETEKTAEEKIVRWANITVCQGPLKN